MHHTRYFSYIRMSYVYKYTIRSIQNINKLSSGNNVLCQFYAVVFGSERESFDQLNV